MASVHDQDDRDVTLPWVSAGAQHRGDALIVDLGRAVRPCSIRLSLGQHAGLFPRVLRITTSLDGEQWTTVLREKSGGRAFLGAVANPRDPQLTFAVASPPARFVALQLDADQTDAGWAVATLSVNGWRLE